MLPLARRLVDRTGSTAAPEAIAERLAAAAAEAHTRWPELGDCDEPFVDALLPRVEGEGDLADALGRLALPDVYVVAACLHGDRGALAAVERMVRAEAARAAGKLAAPPAADDVAQEMLVKLVVAGDGKTPKLAAFGGHGALHAWLRVAAIRTAISMTRRKSEEAADDDALAAIADDSDDQQLAFVKSSYRAEFKRAFAAAFTALPPRSRTLLRLQVLDQLALEEVGAFYQVSRATAARWLADARAELVSGTQRRLGETLRADATELAEMMRLVASSLYSTLPKLLRTK